MSSKARWFWSIYFFIYASSVSYQLQLFISPESPVFLYYKILRSFDEVFNFSYDVTCIRLILTILNLFPLAFYLLRMKSLDPIVWKTLFFLRIIFDVFGDSYFYQYLYSYYLYDPKIFLFMIAQLLIFVFPSYLATYKYAFQWDKIFIAPISSSK